MADFDYQQLDDFIHSRIRLAIMSLLVSIEEAEFTFVRDKVNATDGNLGMHLKKLEDVGYVSVKKEFIHRKPSSSYRLTPKGRRAFELYVARLDQMIKK